MVASYVPDIVLVQTAKQPLTVIFVMEQAGVVYVPEGEHTWIGFVLHVEAPELVLCVLERVSADVVQQNIQVML